MNLSVDNHNSNHNLVVARRSGSSPSQSFRDKSVEMEDRSELFNQLKNFSQRKLKKVETKVVTGTGEQLVEKRGAKGLQVLTGSGSDGNKSGDTEPPRKLDLQVGLILPGFLIGKH